MRTIPLGTSGLQVPTVAVGCMRIKSLGKAEAEHFVNAALEMGANFFDQADIYAVRYATQKNKSSGYPDDGYPLLASIRYVDF